MYQKLVIVMKYRKQRQVNTLYILEKPVFRC